MDHFKIKNWERYQHYKDRNPPWIKVYNTLINDYGFQQLTDTSKWHLIAIWLLASRSTRFDDDGNPLLPADEKYLTRSTGSSSPVKLKPLFNKGFILCSNMLASCQQDAIPETEAETETEKKERHGTHVLLLTSEYESLKEKFGPEKTDSTIEDLDNYIGSKGKRYKSHYHTLKNWMKRDAEKKKEPSIVERYGL